MNAFIKYVIGCMLLCVYGNLCAQQQNRANSSPQETNLFEYGEPLTSGEANLKNLFSNFPKLVKNADEVDLLSYKYVGVVENRRQARDFVEKNIYPNAPGWSVSIAHAGTGDSASQQPVVWLETSATVGSNKSELSEIIKTISEEYIQTGYEVYMIKFVCLLKTYEYYVFVNPKTKQVVTKGNIFGFNLRPI
ncbi:MAG: hypothetical protein LBG15_11405 [Dysgonamonadaceae bacterium]|jgi:hypothetical protein|nr:hypothetical protein [Dysgonamonadaceae bacterium]